MQTIERYGVIVLVLCAVSIGAVWMWERGDEPQTLASEGTAANVAAVPRPGADPRAAARPPAAPPRAEQAPVERPKRNYDRIGTRARSALSRESLEELKETGSDLISSASERLRELTGGTESQPTVIVPSEEVRRATTVEPPSTPKAAPAVAGGDNIYVVEVGDTLSEVSLSQLGTSKRWGDIVKANPGLDPKRLRVGMRLRMPARSVAVPTSAPASTTVAKSTPKVAGKGQVRVEPGDSLWKIAARALGDGARYHELVAANPGIDPDHLLVGQLLALPDGSKPAPAAVERTPPVVANNTPGRGRVL
ncbi:MAG: LysM domain-containing protein [Planctomycetota bacterium]